MKTALIILAVFVAVSLTACASTKPAEIKVKCPACGYEFSGSSE